MKEVKTTLGILINEWGYKKRQNRDYIISLLEELKNLSLINFDKKPSTWNKKIACIIHSILKKDFLQ